MRYRAATAAVVAIGLLGAALFLADALTRPPATGRGPAPAAGDDAAALANSATPSQVDDSPGFATPSDPPRQRVTPSADQAPPSTFRANLSSETPAPVAPPGPPREIVAPPPAASAATTQTARPATVYPLLFGAREIRGANFAPFPKWTGLIERQVNEHVLYDGPCSARRFNRCHLTEWRALLKELDGKPRRHQIEAVNQFMNRAPYIIDPVNYRVSDYWATPLQFLNKDGDCEDYAIAKYISLRELGFPTEMLRIVVLDDLNLGIAHAVLVVYLDGEALILDNQISHVVSAARIRHYRPIYSINEEYWWLHRPPAQ